MELCFHLLQNPLTMRLQDARPDGNNAMASFVVEGGQQLSLLDDVLGVARPVLTGALLAAIGAGLIVYSILGEI